MSWGERSCTQFGSCKHGPTMSSCNVNCQFYVWNGKTKPDSEKMVKTLIPSLREIETPTRCRRDSNHPGGFINRMDEP